MAVRSPLPLLTTLALAACSSDAESKRDRPLGTVGDDLPAAVGDDGLVSRDAALAAYARVFGPLPGATGSGPDGAARTSGTGALRWVLAHFRDLSDEQRAA